MKFPYRRLPHDDLEYDINHCFIDDAEFLGLDFQEQQLKTKVYEEKNGFLIETEITGFDKDEIKLYIENNELIIEGKREDIIDEENDEYIKQESNYAFCKRGFSLEGIDKHGIKATYENNLIHIHLPRKKPLITESENIQIE
ncbi:MAG: Hsp20 family protein [Eubacteriales bacterium]